MRLFRARGIAVCALAVAVAVVGCRSSEPEAKTSSTPRRIVALAPSVTETLFDLGLGSRVVGVGDYAEWPDEVHDLPRLGGLFDVRLEVIAKLEPDLAILIPSEAELAGRLEQLGVEVLMVGSDTLADIEASFGEIARRCDALEAGVEAETRWNAGFDLPPLDSAPRVMLTVGRQHGDIAGALVAGPGTYLDEMLTLAGATNVFADAAIAYPEVGLEEVLRRQPDAIIELQTRAGFEDRLLADWESLEQLPAVSGSCIPVISGDHVMVPGPRLPQLFGEIRAALAECESRR